MKQTNIIKCLLIIIVILTSNLVKSENVLFYFGITGFSHLHSAFPLAVALADKGHNVTVFTSYPPKKKPHPNITTILSEDIRALFQANWDEDADLIRDRLQNNHLAFWDTLIPTAVEACRVVLHSSHSATLNMIHNSHFDLVILDAAYSECGIMLSHYKFNAPYIAYSAVANVASYYDTYGIPMETSVLPDMEFDFEIPLSFMGKLYSTLNSLRWNYKRNEYLYKPLESMAKAGLNLHETPNLFKLNAETSLILVNTFPSVDFARSYPPNFISVGGMQITDKRSSLPSDIKKFLGPSEFIYVSFGTAARISKTDDNVRSKLFNALGNLTSLKFIWKWEGDIPENYPPNIYFGNWLPQVDLYAHENIKGIISHGGLCGINEAIYFGVPMVIFPVFADQDYNANSLQSKGLGIKLQFATFKQLALENAINELVTNPKHKLKALEASKLFKDRPMSSVQTALWWTEYVLRHRNTDLFKPVTRYQTWYEKRLLDVWLFLVIILQLTLLIFCFGIYKICSIFFAKNLTEPRKINGSLKKLQ